MTRIYHYTTLESLKLIVSNSTIRLNLLANMDDMTEGYTPDFGSWAKYIYVSSWSKDSAENIPLWYMYTDKMKGIRIEAESDFLQLEEQDKTERILNITNDNLVAFRLCYGENNSFLCDVNYEGMYMPRLDSSIEGKRGFINNNIYEIGKVKPKAWSFQNEVRFRLIGISKKYMVGYGEFLFHKVLNSIYAEKDNDIQYADIKFDIAKFNNANFILGPACTEEDYIELEKVIAEYLPNHNGKIKKSNLLVRFKEK